MIIYEMNPPTVGAWIVLDYPAGRLSGAVGAVVLRVWCQYGTGTTMRFGKKQAFTYRSLRVYGVIPLKTGAGTGGCLQIFYSL